GQLGLADDLPQDAYTLRAYTAWMCNFDSSYLFTKPLNVFAAATVTDTAAIFAAARGAKNSEAEEAKISLRFFPEGGQMVDGLSSRIAVEARDERGMPLALNGQLLGDDGSEISQFKTNFAGYGAVALTPQVGASYELIVAHEGKAIRVPLPAPQRIGATMQCSFTSLAELRVKVEGKFDEPRRAENMLLAGHVRGELVFITPFSLGKKGATTIKIPTADCPQGILCLTLLDGAGSPCAERLVYVDKGERLSIKFTHSLQRNGSAVTQLLATDADGKPAVAHVSLAALNGDLVALPDSTDENLATYLLLSSDLRGKIYRAGYYFSKAPRAAHDLDLLLLTQGWRRFEVNPALADSIWKIPYPLQKKLLLAGRLERVDLSKATDYSLTMCIYDSRSKMREIIFQQVSSDGTFVVPFDDFCDSLTAKIFTKNKRGRLRNVGMAIAQDPAPPFAPLAHAPDLNAIAQANRKLLDYRTLLADATKWHIVLDDITVTAKRRDRSETGGWLGLPDLELSGAELLQYGTTVNAVLFNMPNVRVEKNDFGDEFLTTDRAFMQSRNMGAEEDFVDAEDSSMVATSASTWRRKMNMVSIHINGAMLDYSALADMPIEDVSVMRFYRQHATIVVASKPGVTHERGVVTAALKGFESARKFYVPTGNDASWEAQRVDYRATLHWQADIETDSSGMASVQWRSTLKSQNVRLRVEGLTAQGAPVFAEATVKVTK
ncbi:MAG: hypothetical protein LBS94_03645, partial [Prevotellaceae bacterium]|nr:hypothetical protein [Prevotellaceae bacterium]